MNYKSQKCSNLDSVEKTEIPENTRVLGTVVCRSFVPLIMRIVSFVLLLPVLVSLLCVYRTLRLTHAFAASCVFARCVEVVLVSLCVARFLVVTIAAVVSVLATRMFLFGFQNVFSFSQSKA